MAAHQAPPCPWDSPGKNTGVGCHCLLQCMKVKSESEVPQLCLTLSDPMDCSPPGSSAHGIFQASVLEWGAIAFSKHLMSYYKCIHLITHHLTQDIEYAKLASPPKVSLVYTLGGSTIHIRPRKSLFCFLSL